MGIDGSEIKRLKTTEPEPNHQHSGGKKTVSFLKKIAFVTLKVAGGTLLFFVVLGTIVIVVGEHEANKPPAPTPPPTIKDIKLNIMDQISLKLTWEPSPLDSVLITSFLVTNHSKYGIKDILFTCRTFGNSGTYIGSTSQTVYDYVPSGGSKHLKNINMGFINTQTKNIRCEISDFGLSSRKE